MINGNILLEKKLLDLGIPNIDMCGEEVYNLLITKDKKEVGYVGSFKPMNEKLSKIIGKNTASLGSLFLKCMDYDNSNKKYGTRVMSLLIDYLRKKEIKYFTLFGIISLKNVNKMVNVGINNNINHQYYFKRKEQNIGDSLIWKIL